LGVHRGAPDLRAECLLPAEIIPRATRPTRPVARSPENRAGANARPRQEPPTLGLTALPGKLKHPGQDSSGPSREQGVSEPVVLPLLTPTHGFSLDGVCRRNSPLSDLPGHASPRFRRNPRFEGSFRPVRAHWHRNLPGSCATKGLFQRYFPPPTKFDLLYSQDRRPEGLLWNCCARLCADPGWGRAARTHHPGNGLI